MRSFLVSLFSLIFSFAVFSQDFKEGELPPNVVTTFYDKYTPTSKVSWTKTADVFVATFKSGDQGIKASFTNDGNWTVTKYEIDYRELPIDVLTYITSNFRDVKIKESTIRESPLDSNRYYIVLKKDGIAGEAEIYFDMKGKFIKQNVPESFNKPPVIEQAAAGIPADIYNAFKKKYPNAIIQSWKNENSRYQILFVKEGTNGKSEYTSEGIWNYTKYTLPEKELPSTIITDFTLNYKEYKIKTFELIQEPGTDYYYLFAKKEGIFQPSVGLFYSMAGKLTKKISSEDEDPEAEFENIVNEQTSADDININPIQKISIKELPSTIMTYIKDNYSGYLIKEALVNTTEKGIFYYVKVKKEGFKAINELTFDINGKFIESNEKDEFE
jgi:hypothetical protein